MTAATPASADRHHGRPINTAAVHPAALVVCSQNHDQIGNRATGDRLSQTLGYGQLALAAVADPDLAVHAHAVHGRGVRASTPWQFFTSHPEPELGKATAEGRIKEFERMGWDPAVVPDPQDPETFTRSKLDWAEAAEGDHARLLELYRALIALRRSTPELAGLGFEDTAVDFSEDDGWLRCARGPVEVAMNFSAEPRRLAGLPGASVVLATDDGVRLGRAAAAGPARPQRRHHSVADPSPLGQDSTYDLFCSGNPLRLHALPPRRTQRAETPGHLPGPLAQLRRRQALRDPARHPAPRLRPRRHPLRPRQQLRPARRHAETNFGRHFRDDFRPVPRRTHHLHQGRLRHVARPVRRMGLPQIPARQPGPVAGPDGPGLRGHLLQPPPGPGNADGRDHGRPGPRPSAPARPSTPASPPTPRSRPWRRPGS